MTELELKCPTQAQIEAYTQMTDPAWMDAIEYSLLAEKYREAQAEIERLRDYACHKFTCAKIKDAVAKCDCGLDELLGEPSRPSPA